MASSGGVFASPDLVQKWYDGVQLYDAGELSTAIEKFEAVTPQCAKMLFNVGCCYLSINEIDSAVKSYEEAIQMDSHMAVSYFMIGLVYYLKNDFGTSFDYFAKARTALRGNKYIDYSQLGLHYKLYACEIKTNQASILVKQNKIGKAKELLLLALTCKTEKRHDIISDSLNMLQAGAGCAMSLFMLPQHIIFRPSQKIISQLKKKDYLGKAKVVAEDNSEDIYACFTALKTRKDGEIPNHVKEEDVKTMLSDLKISDRKEKLKRTPPQKKLPVLNIGKVINNSPKTSPRSNPRYTNGVQNGHVYKKDESSSNPPRRPPLPVGPAPRNYLVETTEFSVQHNKKENGFRYNQAPPRPPPAKISPNINRTISSDSIRNRSSSLPSNELIKNTRKPPPIAQKYQNHMNGNGHYNGDDNNNNNDNWEAKSPAKKVHEVEICYSFTHKIRLKEGLSLSEVQNIVEAQAVPDNIHMCTADEYGRQQPLTQRTLEKLFESNSNKKEIFCSTNPYNKHQNAPT